MELLAEIGLSTAEVIVVAFMQNARYFKIDQRPGSIEKLMLTGVWVNGR
jgi:imidazolonepropionase-like amidohydrolase